MRGEMGKVIHSLLTAFPQGYPQLFHRMSSTYPHFAAKRTSQRASSTGVASLSVLLTDGR